MVTCIHDKSNVVKGNILKSNTRGIVCFQVRVLCQITTTTPVECDVRLGIVDEGRGEVERCGLWV